MQGRAAIAVGDIEVLHEGEEYLEDVSGLVGGVEHGVVQGGAAEAVSALEVGGEEVEQVEQETGGGGETDVVDGQSVHAVDTHVCLPLQETLHRLHLAHPTGHVQTGHHLFVPAFQGYSLVQQELCHRGESLSTGQVQGVVLAGVHLLQQCLVFLEYLPQDGDFPLQHPLEQFSVAGAALLGQPSHSELDLVDFFEGSDLELVPPRDVGESAELFFEANEGDGHS